MINFNFSLNHRLFAAGKKPNAQNTPGKETTKPPQKDPKIVKESTKTHPEKEGQSTKTEPQVSIKDEFLRKAVAIKITPKQDQDALKEIDKIFYWFYVCEYLLIYSKIVNKKTLENDGKDPVFIEFERILSHVKDKYTYTKSPDDEKNRDFATRHLQNTENVVLFPFVDTKVPQSEVQKYVEFFAHHKVMTYNFLKIIEKIETPTVEEKMLVLLLIMLRHTTYRLFLTITSGIFAGPANNVVGLLESLSVLAHLPPLKNNCVLETPGHPDSRLYFCFSGEKNNISKAYEEAVVDLFVEAMYLYNLFKNDQVISEAVAAMHKFPLFQHLSQDHIYVCVIVLILISKNKKEFHF